MASYEYRVVAFVGRIGSAEYSRENAESVATQLEALIDANAAGGWEFYGVEQLQIAVSPGCLGALMGRRQGIVHFDQAVFRRERAAGD